MLPDTQEELKKKIMGAIAYSNDCKSVIEATTNLMKMIDEAFEEGYDAGLYECRKIQGRNNVSSNGT